MKRPKRIIIAGVVAGLVAGVASVVWFGSLDAQAGQNAYAVWWAADLVIEHMETHGGLWPRNWDELQADADHAAKPSVWTNRNGEFRVSYSIEELKQRVEIDWKADPDALAKAEFKQRGPPFRVIWLRNGKASHVAGKEPNALILEYLKHKEKEKPGTEPVTSADGAGPLRFAFICSSARHR